VGSHLARPAGGVEVGAAALTSDPEPPDPSLRTCETGEGLPAMEGSER
jgi:hypothetical protein